MLKIPAVSHQVLKGVRMIVTTTMLRPWEGMQNWWVLIKYWYPRNSKWCFFERYALNNKSQLEGIMSKTWRRNTIFCHTNQQIFNKYLVLFRKEMKVKLFKSIRDNDVHWYSVAFAHTFFLKIMNDLVVLSYLYPNFIFGLSNETLLATCFHHSHFPWTVTLTLDQLQTHPVFVYSHCWFIAFPRRCYADEQFSFSTRSLRKPLPSTSSSNVPQFWTLSASPSRCSFPLPNHTLLWSL